MHISFKTGARQPQTLLGRIFAAIIGVLALVGVAMFGVVILAVVAILGLIFGVYFWWKTRAVRAQLKETLRAQQAYSAQQSASAEAEPTHDGDFIEGEAVRVEESQHLLDDTREPRP